MPMDRVHRLIDNKLHRGSGGWPHPLSAFYRPRSRSDAPVTSRCTRYVTMHPLRHDAPDQKGCNVYGSGAPPHRQQACARIFSLAPPAPVSNRPRPGNRSPVTSRCTRSEGVQCLRIGCTTSSTSSLRAGCLADTVRMLASNRPRPRSITPDTAAMH